MDQIRLSIEKKKKYEQIVIFKEKTPAKLCN